MTVEEIERTQKGQLRFAIWVLVVLIFLIFFTATARIAGRQETNAAVLQSCLVNKKYKIDSFEIACRVDVAYNKKVNHNKVLTK